MNTVSTSGQTALHVLVDSTLHEESRPEPEKLQLCERLLHLLLKAKLKVNHQDEKGFTALHAAVNGKSVHVTRLLAAAPGISLGLEDKRSLTPLQLSCKNETDQITHLLVEHTDVEQLVRPSAANFPLHLLCRCKTEKKSLIELYLRKLEAASSKRGKNYVQMALREVDVCKMPLLHIAAEWQHRALVESLFSNFEAEKDQVDGAGKSTFRDG